MSPHTVYLPLLTILPPQTQPLDRHTHTHTHHEDWPIHHSCHCHSRLAESFTTVLSFLEFFFFYLFPLLSFFHVYSITLHFKFSSSTYSWCHSISPSSPFCCNFLLCNPAVFWALRLIVSLAWLHVRFFFFLLGFKNSPFALSSSPPLPTLPLGWVWNVPHVAKPKLPHPSKGGTKKEIVCVCVEF